MAGAFQYGGPSPMQLANYIQQQGQMGKQQGEDSRLARLVSGAMADPSKRQSNLAEVASFRPDAAFAAQDQFNQQDAARNKRLGEIATIYLGAGSQKANVLKQFAPELTQFGMQLPPDIAPSPEIDDLAQRLSQLYGGMGNSSQLPASVREAQAFRDDPSLLETRRQMYGSYSYGEVPLPDGTVAQTRRNSRTGQMEMVLPGGRVIPMAEATPAAGGQPPTEPKPAGRYPDAMVIEGDDEFNSLPPQMRAEAERLKISGQPFYIANGQLVKGNSPGFMPTGGGAAPQPAQEPRLPSINDIGGGPIPPLPGSGRDGAGFGRPAEVEAAEKKAAEIQTELAYADRVAAAEANAARLKKEAEAAGERTAQAPKRIAAYKQALAGSENVLKAIDDSLALIGPTSTGFLGARLRGVEGSQAYNLAANIETIKANLGFDRLQQMRDNSPTGGALGAIAVQELTALQSTIANLDPNQSDDQIRANLDKVKGHYEKWAKAVEQSIREEEGGGQQAAGQYSAMSDDELKQALGL